MKGLPEREARHLRDDVRKAPALLFLGLAIAALSGLWSVASETGCLPTSGETPFTPLILMPCLGMCITLTTLRQRLVRPDIASPELKRPNFFSRKGSSS